MSLLSYNSDEFSVPLRRQLRESEKAGLALGGYETPISGYEISYRYPVLSEENLIARKNR
eukprot:COSAG02_NODE_45152_length_359_cov_46.769231_1_plen_60_part_00